MMGIVKATTALYVALSLMAGCVPAETPVRVIDGDTIHIGSKETGTRVRLLDIDTAENGQQCLSATGGTWDCAAAATARLQELVSGAVVHCDGDELDRYARLLGRCYADGVDVQQVLVSEGLAWPYLDRGPYVDDAKAAQRAGRGVWQAPTQTPWDWRKEKRSG